MAGQSEQFVIGRDQLISELMALERGVVLTGEAGVGKSTVLRMLALEHEARGSSVVRANAWDGIPEGVLVGAQSRPVLVVDDIQLLDAASIGIVHALASDGTTVLATVRNDVEAPEALRALLRDGLWVHRAVPAFDATGTTAMVERLLDGPADRGLAHDVFARTRGNPLHTRELVALGLASAAISDEHGLWVRRGALPVTTSASDTVRWRYGDLDEDARLVLDLVALLDPLPRAALDSFSGDAAIERATGTGLVAFLDGNLHFEHPIHRDAAKKRMPTLRRRRLSGELATALSGMPGMELTRGQLLLESDTEVEVDDLLAWGAEAFDGDTSGAETFFRAAIERGAGIDARLRLSDLLVHEHRVDEAIQLLAQLAAEPLDVGQQAMVGFNRAFLLAFPGNRPAEALAVVDELAATLGPWPLFAGLRSSALWCLNRLVEAEELGLELLADATLPDGVRAHGGLTVASVRLYSGTEDSVHAHGESIAALVASVGAEIPEGSRSLEVVEACAEVLMGGDPDAAWLMSEQRYLAALRSGDEPSRVQYAYLAGWAQAQRGNLTIALGYLAEARAGRGAWVAMTMPWILALVVRAQVAAGEQAAAESTLAELLAMTRSPLFDQAVLLAAASVRVGAGDREGGAKAAAAAGDQAAAIGAWSIARDAWSTALRFGDASVAERLLSALDASTTPVDRAIRAQAEAVLDDDDIAFSGSVDALESAGALWYATEAQATLVLRYSLANPLLASIAAARLRDLAARCGGLDSPIVAAIPRMVLTTRQAQVAALVVDGHPDRAIAERTGMSIRTVGVHLHEIYTRLGIRSREDLRSLARGTTGS